MKVETEIRNIKKRNFRVEADKAWETSKTRKIILTLLTYFVIVIFLWTANIERPCINAVVPTVAFVLSTLTLPFVKKQWIKRTQH